MNIVHCGPAPVTAGATVNLNPANPDRKVILDIRGVEGYRGASLPNVARDLLTIGAYVFLADGAVARATDNDPTARRWRREFELHVPVIEPDRWARAAVSLSAVLEFATDDSWAFVFRQGAESPTQLHLQLVEPGDQLPTCVSLFSGGLDSLAGALKLCDEGERPMLATHWTTGTGLSFEGDVRSKLALLETGWHFPNPTLRTRRASGSGDAKEMTQRSRGVLYLNLGVAVAMQAGLDRLVVPENGVTSLNLAQAAQSVGAMRSRTTHPKALTLYRELLDALGVAVSIETPFINHTKADVIVEAVKRGGEDLAHTAVSCSHAMFQRKALPHCGTCSQCVDRRLSGIAAGWDDDLERGQHLTDLFLDPLADGPATMYAEQYLRFALELGEMTLDGMAQRQDVFRAVEMVDDPTAELVRIYELLTRHATQVHSAYVEVWARNLVDYTAGRLPRTGLFGRLGKFEHLRQPWQRLADRIAEVITPAIRKAFPKGPPANEAELQREIEVAQTAASLNLHREIPTVRFALVGTRPDFSSDKSAADLDEPDLFVEVKLVKGRRDLQPITDQILADIPKYTDRGRSALFLVYDAAGAIADDRAFAEPLEARGPLRVRVLRR